ncbi:hypothetical protein Y032_0018g3723 [Ancylostoma ceylanicum]|uniref:Uncharacterized protein n=1 Tax=Ancylostoma ceylanicum TaxID=53326 RepID=A0A016V5X4_9BILA|nr:hypothetical protein Y032_0018g3723 [Ancylostoma ceylanicum]
MERRCEKNEKIVLQSAAKVFGQVCRIRKALDSIEINAVRVLSVARCGVGSLLSHPVYDLTVRTTNVNRGVFTNSRSSTMLLS